MASARILLVTVARARVAAGRGIRRVYQVSVRVLGTEHAVPSVIEVNGERSREDVTIAVSP